MRLDSRMRLGFALVLLVVCTSYSPGWDLKLPTITVPTPVYGPNTVNEVSKPPLPPDFVYKVKLGQLQASCDESFKEISRLQKLYNNARRGMVPYAGMTPEYVLKSTSSALREARVLWGKRRRRRDRAWLDYRRWLREREQKKSEAARENEQVVDDDEDEQRDENKEASTETEEPQTVDDASGEAEQRKDFDAKVTYVFGIVEVLRDGQWVPVRRGDELTNEDTIRTRKRSKMEMFIPGMDKIARIKPCTKMTLSAKKRLMKHGDRLWYTVVLVMGGAEWLGLHSHDVLDIRLPLCTVGTRGTTFTTDIDEQTGAETYAVTEGSIEVVSKDGTQRWLIEAGQRLVVETGSNGIIGTVTKGGGK